MMNGVLIVPKRPSKSSKGNKVLAGFCLFNTPEQVKEIWGVCREARSFKIRHLPYRCSKLTAPKHMPSSFNYPTNVTRNIQRDFTILEFSFGGKNIFARTPDEVFDFVWAAELPN